MGATLGIPAGYGLFAVANQGGTASQPPAWWLIAAVGGTILAVAALTSIPARIGARRPVAQILQAETT
jgi:putative ABC transport system permease protein